MNKDEILHEIAAFDESGDTERDHLEYDRLVTDVLRYIAYGGRHPGEVAEAMLRHESPAEWGWYA